MFEYLLSLLATIPFWGWVTIYIVGAMLALIGLIVFGEKVDDSLWTSGVWPIFLIVGLVALPVWGTVVFAKFIKKRGTV